MVLEIVQQRDDRDGRGVFDHFFQFHDSEAGLVVKTDQVDQFDPRHDGLAPGGSLAELGCAQG